MKMKAAAILFVCLSTIACSHHHAGPAEQIGKGLDDVASGVSDYNEKQAERDREQAERERERARYRYRYESDPYYYYEERR